MTKRDNGRVGVKNRPEFCDVIYGQLVMSVTTFQQLLFLLT